MKAPLFIIGCPRSGTTLLLDLLAGTRAFGYVNNSAAGSVATGTDHRRNRIYDVGSDRLVAWRPGIVAASSRIPVAGSVADTFLPRPIEPWRFWEGLIPGFRPEQGDGPAEDPGAHHVDTATVLNVRSAVAALLHHQRRDVFLSKYTDFPRIELMRAVFPEARFVHIHRDGHAVANSYATEIEGGRFGTWRDRFWWADAWPTEARSQWSANRETILGFAAHNRNHLMNVIAKATKADPGVLTVSYEDLIAVPEMVLEQILAFATVRQRGPLDRLIHSRNLINTNDRWRERRSGDETALLNAILASQIDTSNPADFPEEVQ